MASVVLALCDAIATRLNAEPAFDPPITATRHHAPPQYSQAELESVQVAVVPAENTAERANRNQWDDVDAVEIVISRACSPTDGDTLDKLFGLIDAIVDRLRTFNPTGFVLETIGTDPRVDSEELRRNVFHSLSTATYRSRR